MPLAAGTKLGPYEILSPLGAGGMGEVYRARDSKLGREVAIKVLPEEFTEHPQKLARFEREARLLAALNHPGIATLHGLEEAEGKPFLVMELVEGETLAERIARGAIPVEDALAISLQIAEALEAAHEKGVIHRDLKPANIKVDPEGKVKVLDFGLAKAFADESPESELSQSPTLSRDATRAGVILGTAAYMSPEQAKGRAVDKRSDIFSFGIVVYEMLTGKRAFAGEDVSEVLASIIKLDPDWKAVPSDMDPRIQNLLRRCLRKDRKRRLQSVGDIRVQMEDIVAEPFNGTSVPMPEPIGRRLSLGTAVAAALFLCSIAAIAVWVLKPEPARTLVRVVATPSVADAQNLTFDLPSVDVAITPDGRRIVYSANVNGERHLLMRSLDELHVTTLAGPGGPPRDPFISPDGNWVAYFDGTATLRKVSILGGPPVTIGEFVGVPRGGSWGADDMIIFATIAPNGLWRVPAGGGVPESLAVGPVGEAYTWPEILPAGEAVLFTKWRESGANAQVAVLSLITGEIEDLIPGGSNPRYVSTGHIVYGAGGTLRTVSFDVDKLDVTSDPVPVLEGVITKGESGATEFSISRDGSLVYMAGDSRSAENRVLVWVDREGREEVLPAEPRTYAYPRISPDGSQVAIDVRDQENDIWIWDLTRETLRRVTFGSAGDTFPAWTPDGKRLAFASSREGIMNLFWKAADGTGTVERLTESEHVHYTQGFSPNGEQLVFYEIHPERQRDIAVLSMDGDLRVEYLLATESDERNAEISPNGRWLAYQSNESGQFEVYVRPFPNVHEGLQQVSRNGGTRPLWARDGRELFYLNARGQLMSISVRTDPSFTYDTPEVILEQTYFIANTARTYDVHPNGERFLMIKDGTSSDDATPAELILVQNWTEELKRLVPTN